MAILGTWEDGSDAWHEARATRIGGSDIGTIMGWSPFESRQQLLERKAGLMDPKPTTAAMKRGHWLEPAVLAFLADKHGIEIDTERRGTFTHDDHPWALANPDGITTDGILLEAKTTADRSNERGWGRAGTDQIPLHYVSQVVWYCGVIGLDRAYLGVLAGAVNGRASLSFASYTIRFDAELFSALIEAGKSFMDELEQLTERATA